MKNFDWHQFKLFVEHASGISMDALHILAGLGIFLLTSLLFRRAIASGWPLLLLLVLELGNEAYDISVERWPDVGMQLGEGAKDVMLTIILPAVLTAVARWRPDLLTPRGNSAQP
jgi:hypothetical protein